MRIAFTAVTIAALACRSAPAADPTAKSARVAPPEVAVSCEEWTRRAQANPELEVERVPEVIAYKPEPIPKRLPKGVLDRNGRGEVRIRVLVDTLGAPDMRTFTVVRSTHATLTRSVRAAVAKWRFRPAEVSGCKVPRAFLWGAVTGDRPAAK